MGLSGEAEGEDESASRASNLATQYVVCARQRWRGSIDFK